MSETTETELLARVAQGDTEAFAALYDRLSGPLFSFALSILKNSASAEDVLQEVFIQIWEKASTYDSEIAKPLTWALTLTRNRAIDRLRSLQRRQRLAEAAASEPEFMPDSVGGSDEALINRETALRVRNALDALPVEQRQAIEMAFFGGLSQSEIASALSVPLGTVKARIRRGMLQLRDVLGGL
jgi:RNA polymerase sigma-70 factor (ECF subfamily)